MSLVAYMLGARVIEKHFTLSHAAKGTDHAFSLMPEGMRKLVRDLQRIPAAIGDGESSGRSRARRSRSRRWGRSSSRRAPLPAGHVLAAGDLVAKSPADGGLPPYELDGLLGCTLARPLAEDEADPRRGRRAGSVTRRRDADRPPDDALRSIALVVFDFDGVFTDNRVRVNQRGEESVTCWRGDGLGLRRLDEVGVPYVIVSTEPNPVVGVRAEKLRARCLHGVDDKLAVVRAEAAAVGVGLEAVAYIGNDVNDAACLEAVGLPVVPADAWPEVVPLARWVLERPGGHGCVRELCDAVWRARGHASLAPSPVRDRCRGLPEYPRPSMNDSELVPLGRRSPQGRGGQRRSAWRIGWGRCSTPLTTSLGGDPRRRRERGRDVRRRPSRSHASRPALQGHPALAELRAPGRALGRPRRRGRRRRRHHGRRPPASARGRSPSSSRAGGRVPRSSTA